MAKQLHKGDDRQRRLGIIGTSRAKDAPKLPQLLARLAVETSDNCRHIVRALGNIGGHDAEKTLLELLVSESGLMLGDIAHPLGKLQCAKAIHLLEPLVDHPDAWVRQNATFAIRQIKGTRR